MKTHENKGQQDERRWQGGQSSDEDDNDSADNFSTQMAHEDFGHMKHAIKGKNILIIIGVFLLAS